MEEKESKIEDFWDRYGGFIVCAGMIIVAYRSGRRKGYNDAIGVIDHTIAELNDVLEITKF